MELMGAQFSLTMGVWRLRLSVAIDDTDLQAQQATQKVDPTLPVAPAVKANATYSNRR